MKNEFYIGDVKIENKLVLAPMAGVCNQSFRSLLKEKTNVGLVCAEMVSDKAIYHSNTKTINMLNIAESEHPISIQVFGSDVETMVHAAKYIEETTKADIIDINMGCPVSKVTKNNSGAGLMRDPDLVKAIIENVVAAVKVPVTVKMRIGWDDESINVVELAKIAEKAGAKAISIHGRTAKQMYTGSANWEIIRQVKNSVNIPVIGNGDVKSIEDAKEILKVTNCDAIMIGREALKNPFIFKEINEYFDKNQETSSITFQERKEFCLELAKRLIVEKGEKVGIKEMRKFTAWIFAGQKNSKMIKNSLHQINTLTDLENLLNDYKIGD